MAEPAPTKPLPPGRVDIHSHLLPGIDDGCEDVEASFECVRRLKAFGYVGTVCTPHFWHEMFPLNTTQHVRAWVAQLQGRLDEAGLEYRLWPGGELRLFKEFSRWARDHELPVMGNSKCLLFDFWADKWPKWVVPNFEWLLSEGYQPILAHPERLSCQQGLSECLETLQDMGVWLQGNFRCMTGEEGYQADQMIRFLLRDGRYHFLALDMHRPNSLESRLDGLRLVEAEFGVETVDRLAGEAPRRLLGLN
jgi:protein-tyrosine phosphatase